jgi:hypothetical protein
MRWAQYCAMMQTAELGIPTQQSELDLPPADDIKINDTGPVMRAAGNVIELVPMNFSFPPSGRGGPVFNFRSEGRHFDKQSLPDTSISVLRIHRQEISQSETPVHAQWRALPRHCRPLAGWQGWRPTRLYNADHLTRPRCGALPLATDRGAAPRGLGSVDLFDEV